MKKYLVDFLRDFGIEPTFLVMSIAILIIISITALIIHILLHKIILKAIILKIRSLAFIKKTFNIDYI